MRRSTLFLTLILAAGVFGFFRWHWTPEKMPNRHSRHATILEPSPVCPWREPQRDLLKLFPPATNYVMETRILSGMTAQITKRLGRHMNPDENPLRIYRVAEPGATGSVLITRVKGEFGSIEIVIGVHPLGDVYGVLIQSQRESEAVARIIASPGFLDSFAAKNASSPLRIGEDLPVVPDFARASAQAIANGVRDQLIVFSFAEMPAEAHGPETQANH